MMGIRVYRDIYVKGYKKFPTQKLTGRNDLLYTGKVICGVTETPTGYDKDVDLYINCDCDFPKWRKLVFIKTKSKK